MFTTRRILIAAVIVLLGACVNDSQGPAPKDPVTELSSALEQVIDLSVIPVVSKFHQQSKSLESAANTFCSQKDAANLSALQQQWRQLFEQWYRLSLYNFGPLNDDFVTPPYTFVDSLRLRGTDYTATVRSEIQRDIAGTHALNDDWFANKTFQRVGLLPLEALIFETSPSEHSKVAADIVADYQMEARKCDILKGLSKQLVARASYVENGWKVAFAAGQPPYRTLFLNGQLEDGTAPVNQLILSAQAFLDYLKARSVVNKAGKIADHAWQAIEATIGEVEEILAGTSSTTTSLFDVMEAAGKQNEVAKVRENIAAVKKAVADRDAPMLSIAIGSLDGNFKREIPSALNVELGINFSDGD